jgi:D-arginine dehydrogenase
VPAEEVSRAEAVRRVGILSSARFDGAVFTADDGVVDVANLLELFLRRARAGGVRLLLETPARHVLIENGRACGVRTDAGDIRAGAVVVAAGAWSGGLVPVTEGRPPLVARRRHLFVTGPLPWADPAWPIVWNLSAELYFRPEPPGLLLCPCDEEDAPPGTPHVDPEITILLATLLEAWVPALRDVPIARSWAGLRTFAPDRRFRLGSDAELPGLFWAAALGGHGVTCSPAVGRVVAEAVLDSLGIPRRDP